MSHQIATDTSMPQGGDQPSSGQYGQPPPGQVYLAPNLISATGSSAANSVAETDAPSVPLKHLKAKSEWIDCPNCHKRTRTRIEGRSKGMKTFMNVFWWPLPDRKEWWETKHWHCQHCNKELAVQKRGKDLQVLVV